MFVWTRVRRCVGLCVRAPVGICRIAARPEDKYGNDMQIMHETCVRRNCWELMYRVPCVHDGQGIYSRANVMPGSSPCPTICQPGSQVSSSDELRMVQRGGSGEEGGAGEGLRR